MLKLILLVVAAMAFGTDAWAADCLPKTRRDPATSWEAAPKCICDYGYTMKGGKCAKAVEESPPKPKPKVE